MCTEQVVLPVLGHVLKHMPRHVLEHVPGHMLGLIFFPDKFFLSDFFVLFFMLKLFFLFFRTA